MIGSWLKQLSQQFLEPTALALALLAVPLLLLWAWEARRRVRALAAWTGEPPGRLTSEVGARPTRPARAGLLAVVLLLTLAAAQPWWGRTPVPLEADARRFLILLDVSRSMLAEDRSEQSRLQRARHYIDQWIGALTRTGTRPRIGLILFAGEARLILPPATDIDWLRQRLLQADAAMLGNRRRLTIGPEGTSVGTAYGPVLRLTQQALAADGPGPAMVILVTDGDDLAADGPDHMRPLAQAGIGVVVCGVGRPDPPSFIPTGDGANPFLLRSLPDGSTARVETRRRDDHLAQLAAAGAGSLVLEESTTAPLADWWHQQASGPNRTTWEREVQAPIPRYRWLIVPALFILMLEYVASCGRPRASRPATPPPVDPLKAWVASGGTLMLLILLGASSPPAELHRAAEAYERGDYLEAIDLYDRALRTYADPGLIAFNQAACWNRLEAHDAAALAYRQCLEDATGLRRHAALYGLGNALAQSGAAGTGAIAVSRLRSALLAYDQVLGESSVSPSLQADAEHNRLLVQQLLLERERDLDEPVPPAEPPPPAPTATPRPQVPAEGEGADVEEGTTQRRPGRGALPVLLDDRAAPPLSATEAEAHLADQMQRLRELQRATSASTLVKDKDW